MTKFEKLMEDRPKMALKKVNEFMVNPFWEYFVEQMEITQEIYRNKLMTCELEEVESVRAKLFASLHVVTVPDNIVEQIQDLIELKKESKRVEEARRPE
jgi:predicted metal-dependent TIM-barrel fold hydrolase